MVLAANLTVKVGKSHYQPPLKLERSGMGVAHLLPESGLTYLTTIYCVVCDAAVTNYKPTMHLTILKGQLSV